MSRNLRNLERLTDEDLLFCIQLNRLTITLNFVADIFAVVGGGERAEKGGLFEKFK